MLYVNELLERVALQPIFVLQEDFKRLLGPTPIKQHKALQVLIKTSLLDYERYDLWDLPRIIYVGSYQFQFTQELGDTDFNTLPIPEQIVYVKTGTGALGRVNPWMQSGSMQLLESDFGTSFSARLWQYSKPILRAQYQGPLLCRTLCHRPYVFNTTVDNSFSNDSRIYQLDIDNLNFYNVFYRNILNHVRTIRDSITMTLPVQFLMNMDDEINKLNNIIDTYVRTNAKGMNLWRK